MIRILILGDVVGRGGRQALKDFLARNRESNPPDVVIINGDNLSHGRGISPKTATEAFDAGADIITNGDHVWGNAKARHLLETNARCCRPSNYPPGAPGQGSVIMESGIATIAVLNLMGRVFIHPDMDDPFRAVEQWLDSLPKQGSLITLVDFHAEATSEKRAMGLFLDGRVTALWGTHTHVPTADEQILPNGTAYMTDVGMVGAAHSVIGFQPQPIIERFKTQIPRSFDVIEDKPWEINAILLTVDPATGKAVGIERIREIVQ